MDPVVQDTAIVVLARAPVAARMQTRLARQLAHHVGDARAVELQRCIGGAVVGALVEPPRPYEVTVAFTPPHEGGTIRTWLRGADRYEPQPPGDLGMRIAVAMERARRRGHPRVIVVGTEAPAVQSQKVRESIAQACDWLDHVDCVLGPTLAGGYWLVGATRPLPIFHDMPWGDDALLERTRERLLGADLSWCELEPVADLEATDDAGLARLASVPGMPGWMTAR